MKDWSEPTTATEVAKRAAGRNHHNAIRRFRMLSRQRQVLDLFGGALVDRGVVQQIAASFGVSMATASRDRWAALHCLHRQPPERCGCKHGNRVRRRLAERVEDKPPLRWPEPEEPEREPSPPERPGRLFAW